MGTKSEYTRADYLQIPPEEIVLIGIDTDDGDDHVLVADPANHEPLDDKMVHNFMYLGVMTPIWVRKAKMSSADGPVVRYECIFGRTRVLGAREANKRLTEQGRATIKVPCLVKTLEERMLAAAILSENEMRRVTSPLEKARALQRAFVRGITPEEAALIFGVVPASIERWQKLASLAPAIIERVESKQINATAALAVADLPQDQQVQALDASIEKAKASGRKHVSGAVVKRGVHEDGGHTPLSQRLLRKLATAETRLGLLHPEAEKFLRWMVDGDGEDEVQGLRLLLKAVTEKKAPKVKKEPVEAAPKRPRGRPRKVVTEAAPKVAKGVTKRVSTTRRKSPPLAPVDYDHATP